MARSGSGLLLAKRHRTRCKNGLSAPVPYGNSWRRWWPLVAPPGPREPLARSTMSQSRWWPRGRRHAPLSTPRERRPGPGRSLTCLGSLGRPGISLRVHVSQPSATEYPSSRTIGGDCHCPRSCSHSGRLGAWLSGTHLRASFELRHVCRYVIYISYVVGTSPGQRTQTRA